MFLSTFAEDRTDWRCRLLITTLGSNSVLIGLGFQDSINGVTAFRASERAKDV